MHEYSIAQNIIKIVLKELEKHQFEKISVIRLKIGRFNLLTNESLQEAFNLATENTRLKGAVLEIEETPGMEIELKEIETE